MMKMMKMMTIMTMMTMMTMMKMMKMIQDEHLQAIFWIEPFAGKSCWWNFDKKANLLDEAFKDESSWRNFGQTGLLWFVFNHI